jgi:hypothetical protein
MPQSVTPRRRSLKANRIGLCLKDGFQRARHGAMHSYGKDVAKLTGQGYTTFTHRLGDITLDPVREVADNLRALRSLGAAPDRLNLYALEILEVLKPAPRGASLPAAMDSESCIDADENVVGDRAMARSLSPEMKRLWADQLRRQAAASLALADALEASLDEVVS